MATYIFPVDIAKFFEIYHIFSDTCICTASIFDGILIKQSGPMVFILNLDKVSLKKLFPTMNI